MAKGKSSKSSGKTSAGVHSNVSRKLTNAIRSEYLNSPERLINQLRAHKQGKRVVVTIANPNKEEAAKGKAFMRVPASTIWRDPRAFNA